MLYAWYCKGLNFHLIAFCFSNHCIPSSTAKIICFNAIANNDDINTNLCLFIC